MKPISIVRFNQPAWASLVVGLCCALAGCETFYGAGITISSPKPVDPACVDAASRYVKPVDEFARIQEGGEAVHFDVRLGDQNVQVSVIDGPPPSVELVSSWKGKSSDEFQRATLLLLSDVYDAVVRSCDIREPPATISTICRMRKRHCDGWMKQYRTASVDNR